MFPEPSLVHIVGQNFLQQSLKLLCLVLELPAAHWWSTNACVCELMDPFEFKRLEADPDSERKHSQINQKRNVLQLLITALLPVGLESSPLTRRSDAVSFSKNRQQQL
ncbi:hypothetical protein ILYODFUR_005344 [Ilyodon furcidens]|uniref:Uncharacterized protein n=1 Tax=Ilyodon furcidens TaxID=33524 RepID=A0ABV0SWL0_9TELE